MLEQYDTSRSSDIRPRGFIRENMPPRSWACEGNGTVTLGEELHPESCRLSYPGKEYSQALLRRREQSFHGSVMNSSEVVLVDFHFDD